MSQILDRVKINDRLVNQSNGGVGVYVGAASFVESTFPLPDMVIITSVTIRSGWIRATTTFGVRFSTPFVTGVVRTVYVYANEDVYAASSKIGYLYAFEYDISSVRTDVNFYGDRVNFYGA